MPRCLLLELPPELRDAIYEYACTSDATTVTFRLDKYQQGTYQEAIQPALTRVNRQVRVESLPVYYACNDFVMHTEESKAKDASRWLECNEPHLLALRRVSLWVRYVPVAHDLASSQGAFSITMERDATEGRWKVDDMWKWITVVRKPATVEGDAAFLTGLLRNMLVNGLTSHISSKEFSNLLTDVRLKYLNRKR